MSGRGRPQPSQRSKEDAELARLRKLAWSSTLSTTALYGLGLLIAASWWVAQVTGRVETQSKGYVEGDPFPWLTVAIGVGGGTFLVMYAVDAWRDYRRLRRKRRLQAPSDPQGPTA